jgi:hypothetical protein
MVKQVANNRKGRGKYSLMVRWMTGHSRIRGNEEADKEAKSAAKGNSSAAKDIPSYIRKMIKKSILALKQDHKRLKDVWKTEWNNSERYK